MSDITGVILGAGLAALVGAVLLWRGMLGKRHGDHPYCRRCGRNLFGTSSDGKVCPECGADLAVPRAIVIGVRQRRVGLAVTGAAMLMPGVLVLLGIVGAVVSGVDWERHKPPWLLVHEGVSSDQGTRDAALAELNSRFGAGTLSNAQALKVIEAGLDYQGHSAKPWSAGWGDFIEAAGTKGILSQDQWSRYAKQAIDSSSFKLTMRPRVHAGDPLGYVLQTGGGVDRAGKASGLYKMIRINGLTLDGTDMLSEPVGGFLTLPLSAGVGSTATRITTASGGRVFLASGGAPAITYSSSGGASIGGFGGGGFGGSSLNVAYGRAAGSSRGSLELDPAKMQQLAAGGHVGDLKLEVKVTSSPVVRSLSRNSYSVSFPAGADQKAVQEAMRKQQAQMANDLFNAAAPTLADVEVKLPVKLEIVPANESTIQRVADEKQLRKQVEDSFSVSRVRMMGTRLDVMLNCSNAPTDLSYDVIVRQGEKEWPAGMVAVARGEGLRGMSILNSMGPSAFLMPNDGPSAGDPVDVVLRPTPTAAMVNPNINSYYDGEVVIKNVPLEPAGGFSATPAAANVSENLRQFSMSGGFGSGSSSASGPGPMFLAPRSQSTTQPIGAANEAAVVIRIETRQASNGKVAESGPKSVRELLAFPGRPFLERSTGEDGTITTISGELGQGVDAKHYQLKMTYSAQTADGSRSTDHFTNINVALDQPRPFGGTGGTAATGKTVTLTLPTFTLPK